MSQDFIIEFDYFENRIQTFNLLGRIADLHTYPTLREFRVYINNIPSSLELYVHLSYAPNAFKEIEWMKELLFSLGTYRPDLSSKLLFFKQSDRRFDSFNILDSADAKSSLFAFRYQSKTELSYNPLSESHIQRLRKKGYNAFEKLTGGTSLFLSHSSKQKNELEKVIPYLTAANELIWLDKFRLKPDQNKENIKEEITSGLNDANTVFFYITEDFLKSKWCKLELDISIGFYLQKENYNFLLVIHNEVNCLFLSEYNFFNENFDKDMILLIDSSQTLESCIELIVKRIGDENRL